MDDEDDAEQAQHRLDNAAGHLQCIFDGRGARGRRPLIGWPLGNLAAGASAEQRASQDRDKQGPTHVDAILAG
jgi:hypothetical protein